MLRLIMTALGAAALVVMFLGQAAVVAMLALGTFLFALFSHAASWLRPDRSWAYAGPGWDRFPDRSARAGHLPRRLFRRRNSRDVCRNAWRFRRDDAAPPGPSPDTGHAAFDEYRAETLQRLEQEAKEFQDFLARLRRSRDKAEFDQFLSARRAEAGGAEET